MFSRPMREAGTPWSARFSITVNSSPFAPRFTAEETASICSRIGWVRIQARASRRSSTTFVGGEPSALGR